MKGFLAMDKLTTIGTVFSHNELVAALSQQEFNLPDNINKAETIERLADILSTVRCFTQNNSLLVSAYDITVAVTGSTNPDSYISARIRRHLDCKEFADRYMFKSEHMPKSQDNPNPSFVLPFEQSLALVALYPFKSIQDRVYGIIPPPKNKRTAPVKHRRKIPDEDVIYYNKNGRKVTWEIAEYNRKYNKKWQKENLQTLSIRVIASSKGKLINFAHTLSMSTPQFVLAACKEKANRDGLIVDDANL